MRGAGILAIAVLLAIAIGVGVMAQVGSRGRSSDHGTAYFGNVPVSGGAPCLPVRNPGALKIREVLSRFLIAYNARNTADVLKVFQPVDIYDPMAVILVGQLDVQDPGVWVRAGEHAKDRFRITMACILGGPHGEPSGADIVATRSNAVLTHAGVASVTIGYKVQIYGSPTKIMRLVGESLDAGGDQSRLCAAFGARFEAAGNPYLYGSLHC